MKILDIKDQMKPIAENAKRDDDKYFFIYFSREDDKFSGAHDMDFGDALIAAQQIIDDFGIHPHALTVPSELTPPEEQA